MSVNQITGAGITVEEFSDVWNDLVNGTPTQPGLLSIYGIDTNIQQNSPDGEWVNNLALIISDVLELIVQVYNSFDPDQAVGIDLDRDCSYCGITRMAGSYTQVYITVVTSQSLNLAGQDTSTPYTIQDGNANQYQLLLSASLAVGANTLLFQAVNIGAIQVLPNTITTQVTVVAGVSSVNNPSGAFISGQNQETDAQLRQRRQASTSLPAQGTIPGLTAGLLTIPGIEDAVVYENTTGSPDAQGIPGHSIWVVVNGANIYNNLPVADMIAQYRSMGCGMKGNETVEITLPNGSLFPISFDYADQQLLYIQMTLSSINFGSLDNSLYISSIIANYTFSIYSPANISEIVAIINSIDPTVVVDSCQVSVDNTNWHNSVYPTSWQSIFYLTTSSIAITD